jgi:DNA adenine methylase
LATKERNCAKKVKISAERLMDVAQRVADVHVDNVSSEKCIKQWDSKDTVFYVDPPYPSTDQGHYKGFSQADFERLIDQLSSIKGRAVLSCYPNDAVPKSWQRVEIKTNCSASARHTGKREPRVECVWITP